MSVTIIASHTDIAFLQYNNIRIFLSVYIPQCMYVVCKTSYFVHFLYCSKFCSQVLWGQIQSCYTYYLYLRYSWVEFGQHIQQGIELDDLWSLAALLSYELNFLPYTFTQTGFYSICSSSRVRRTFQTPIQQLQPVSPSPIPKKAQKQTIKKPGFCIVTTAELKIYVYMSRYVRA